MQEFGAKVEVTIEEELKKSYLDYAMSVIIGRALPDVRDGLKPAHRRILYAMFKEGLLWNKKYSKCAGVVGEVLKKYHPHGDAAVYDTLVRMAQDWNMRYPLIDGQGNFGSIDGDPPAAYRYTEARLGRISEEMLLDIEKETVDFVPNYDGSTEEPRVLPARLPNLLVNGSAGIAVGMATNIPPHNLGEVIAGVVAVIDDPEIETKALMKLVPGPDFPTGGYIHGMAGIKEAYETGKGLIQVRGKMMVETHARTGKTSILITEIPYQLNKTRLIERIAELVRAKKLEGVSDLRDESDREGMRIVVELKKDANPAVVRNNLFKHTPLQDSFGIIMLAIVNNRPQVLPLKQTLELFVKHRKEVVTRRSLFELKKAEEREHILIGLQKALDQLDAVIALIRKSKTPPEAKDGLIKKFDFTERQALAILDMRLQRLTGLERQKILDEFKEVKAEIKRLKEILGSEKKILGVVKSELLEIKQKYADPRRTEIVAREEEMTVEDLIAEEDMVVTISHSGYIKRNAVSLYRAQRRGGRGKTGMTTREEDFVEDLFVASTHSHILFFTNRGKAYCVKVHEIPQAGRAAKGKAIVNLINVDQGEQVQAILPVRAFEEGKYILMATKRGLVKKTDLMAYANIRANGLIACVIEAGDELIAARLTDGERDIILSSRNGKAVRFQESEARPMGRATRGVKGMSLGKGDELISLDVIGNGEVTLLSATERGYGKRTAVEEYPLHHRGGQGVITIKTTERNDKVAGVLQVTDEDELMLINSGGKIVRIRVKDISVLSRNTQGVRLISLEQGEKVAAVSRMAEQEETNGENSGEHEAPGSDQAPAGGDAETGGGIN
jgi:DNA gyrase subunit A